jgi:hypothetical protein
LFQAKAARLFSEGKQALRIETFCGITAKGLFHFGLKVLWAKAHDRSNSRAREKACRRSEENL